MDYTTTSVKVVYFKNSKIVLEDIGNMGLNYNIYDNINKISANGKEYFVHFKENINTVSTISKENDNWVS